MSDKYILNKRGEPKKADLLPWARWYETADRQLAETRIEQTRISTVFLGLDHSFGLDGPPVLWETMVFGGKLDEEQCRYTSKDDALTGHARMVKRVKEGRS